MNDEKSESDIYNCTLHVGDLHKKTLDTQKSLGYIRYTASQIFHQFLWDFLHQTDRKNEQIP